MTAEDIMRICIAEAKIGANDNDEVPVGAVIVKDGEIIAKSHNGKEANNCAIYHAEIIAIMEACKQLGNWRLEDCEMYVTLEPCPMCAGAIINSRLKALHFGAYDAKAGCCGSLYNIPTDLRFNHRLLVSGGMLKEECGKMLSEYFKNKRNERKSRIREATPEVADR